jgi:hypothetical protein
MDVIFLAALACLQTIVFLGEQRARNKLKREEKNRGSFLYCWFQKLTFLKAEMCVQVSD